MLVYKIIMKIKKEESKLENKIQGESLHIN